jgi:hypothetical protein
MRNRFLICLLGAGMAVALSAGLAAAKTSTVQFIYRARLGNGPIISPGSYHVVLMKNSSKPEVAFYKGRKQVAEAPVKLVSVAKKNSETAVIYDQSHKNSNIVTEIDLDGWNQNMVFSRKATP